jgi:hypothetical protein
MPHFFPPSMEADGAKILFDSDNITVPAGGEAVVVVKPYPPKLDSGRLPVYSGFIALNTTDGESLSLPYLGLSGSLYSLDPLYKQEPYKVNIQDGMGGFIQGNETFTFPKGDLNFNYTYPVPNAWAVIGTAEFRIDVISLDSAFNQKEVAGVKVMGSVKYFPMPLFPAGVQLLSPFNGQLNDDSFVPAGGYKLMWSALRIFGDASKPEDWDVVVSPQIFIEYIVEDGVA